MKTIDEIIRGTRAAQAERIYRSFKDAPVIEKAEDDLDIEKARSGIYADNAKNRKLNRVGQKYGKETKRDFSDMKKYVLDAKTENLKRFLDNSELSSKDEDFTNFVREEYEKRGKNPKEYEKRVKAKEAEKMAKEADKLATYLEGAKNSDSFFEVVSHYVSGYFDPEQHSKEDLDKLKILKKYYNVKQGKYFHDTPDGFDEADEYEEKMKKRGYIVAIDYSGGITPILIKKKQKYSTVVDVDDFDTKKAQENDIEKSDIMDAISGSDIKVAKTGKEIKEQADTILMRLTANLAEKENEAKDLLRNCGAAPTKCPDRWWTDGVRMDCGWKIYDWEETYIPTNNGIMSSLSAADAADKKGNVPESQEQANCRRKYNDVVMAICNIKVDIKACEILKTLNDNKEFALSPRQVMALGF